MEYHEAANALFDLRRFAPRPGTAATEALLDHLGNPETGYDCIQIAGSNGKGSTARMVASVLRAAGFDVGLYTSPHLDHLGERIRVNGRPLTKGSLVEFVESVEPYLTDQAADGAAPTFFETVTALALWEFGRQSVDIAVLEVGIGGRYDATSAVDPIAAAVTAVTLEHTDILGETIEEIARDKAQVAPVDRPLVTGATGPALTAITDEIEEIFTVSGAGPALAAHAANGDDGPDQPDLSVSYNGRDGLEGQIEVQGKEWALDARLPLLGAHQARNAGVAVALARQVGVTDPETIATGLRRAHWPGRFEVVGREPLVVLDGGHNPGGCRAVAETLAEFDYDSLHVVVGSMADKDHRGMAAAFADADRVTTCRPDRERAASPAALARAFEQETDAAVERRTAVRSAVDGAIEAADPNDVVLVVGSLYTVGEARTRWSRSVIETDIDSIATAEAALDRTDVTDAGTWRMRGKAVHRALRTRVRPRQAQYLKEELLSLGGECAVSGLDADTEENVPVLCMGTLAQFRRLLEKLEGQPYGLSGLASEFREALGIGVRPEEGPYPWSGPGTAIMGILNVTPDSFYDGGKFNDPDAAVAQADAMIDAGADIIDVGGESTRPGAEPISAEAELERVLPVVEAIADRDALVSVDTRKPAVAQATLDAGADILNDVSGLEDPAMRRLAAEFDVPVVMMHSIETPVNPDRRVEYDDVVTDVIDELRERVLMAERAGLDRSQILVDPGLGFGKRPAESHALLDRLGEFHALGCPVLVGHSRKSMFADVATDAGDRLPATIAASAIAAERGADVVRVHDVAENRAAIDVVRAAQRSRQPEE
ncbi:MAG: dihydropteroate synthase [Salinirussus sp.]